MNIVHCIVNNSNGLLYVDATPKAANLDECLKCHSMIAKNVGESHPFYADFITHGEQMFEVIELDRCVTDEDRDANVERWIRLLGSNIPTIGYNVV